MPIWNIQLETPQCTVFLELITLILFLLQECTKKKDVRWLEEHRGIKHKEIVSVGCTYLDVYKEKMEKFQSKKTINLQFFFRLPGGQARF